jgi:hypothetical protein
MKAKVTRTELKRILDSVALGQCGWESGEDIMLFNHRPIGATIGRNIDIGRWWPDLKNNLVELLFAELNKNK